jgi:hypothetical protein
MGFRARQGSAILCGIALLNSVVKRDAVVNDAKLPGAYKQKLAIAAPDFPVKRSVCAIARRQGDFSDALFHTS